MNLDKGIKILYVDDEINNLIGFKASLRLEYEVFTTTDIAEAYKLITEHPDIRIVFCDQRMPQQTGVRFFADLKEKHPDPVRILLTAYTDVEDIIEAINRGHIFRYIRKPWIMADVVSAIEEANKFYIASSLLAVRNRELQLAYNDLDKFAYNVSHHIRSPITGILTALNLAMDTDNLEDVKDILSMIDTSVKKLDGFILNMYDYYNLRQGELTITFIDTGQLLQELDDKYSAYAQAEQILFTTSIKGTEPLRSDAPSLKFIITNLLDHALKFQDPSQTEKKVVLDILTEQSNITVKVSATGTDIPAEELSELFDVFVKANDNKPGSGYGLYRVKHLLVKLGGSITAEVRYGTTLFTVVIPNKL